MLHVLDRYISIVYNKTKHVINHFMSQDFQAEKIEEVNEPDKRDFALEQNHLLRNYY